MFIALILVMVSRLYACANYQSYTVNMCSFVYQLCLNKVKKH